MKGKSLWPLKRGSIRCLFFLALCGCSAPRGAGSAEGEAASMRVLWTVSGYTMTGESALDERQAKALLFAPLDVTDSAITFNGRSCRGIRFSRERVAAATYLPLSWRVTPAELGIRDPEIEVVRTDCTLPGFREYLRLDDSRLVVEIGRTFFHFAPAVAY